MKRNHSAKTKILVAWLFVSMFLLGQCVAAEPPSDKVIASKDFKFLMGNWNPSDAGKDDPSTEDYRWFTTHINGRKYKATNDDIYFAVVNGKPVIGGQGGRLEVTDIKPKQQEIILSVLRAQYGRHKALKGEVAVSIQNRDQIKFTFKMPADWDDAFGREDVSYLRAEEVP